MSDQPATESTPPTSTPEPGAGTPDAQVESQPQHPTVPAGRTRAATFYIYAVTTAVLAIALIDFIAQNNHREPVHFLGWSGQISEAVALLISAVFGALLLAVPGSVRLLQLRTRLRRANRRP